MMVSNDYELFVMLAHFRTSSLPVLTGHPVSSPL